jgi:hypothetical protein
VPKAAVVQQVTLEDQVRAVPGPPTGPSTTPEVIDTGDVAAMMALFTAPTVRVPLVRLAWARSGDKGDDENIGVIARRPEYLPWIRAQLTAQRVADYFAHLLAGPVERFDVPGLKAVNFVLRRALDGGGVSSLRSDPLGKSFAQMLLDLQIEVPMPWSSPSERSPQP